MVFLNRIEKSDFMDNQNNPQTPMQTEQPMQPIQVQLPQQNQAYQQPNMPINQIQNQIQMLQSLLIHQYNKVVFFLA